MATYTASTGIEKPVSGNQDGVWGETANDNYDIIDRGLHGVGTITLSGTAHTLTTTDGAVSEGHYRVLVLGGSPSGTNTITVSPSDQTKLFIVYNNSGQTATFTQGSGGNVSVPDGLCKMIYCDGAGAAAAVVDLTALMSFLSSSAIGSTVQGYDADTLKSDVPATLTAGYDATPQALGTVSSGTVTPEVDDTGEQNFKTLTNNGAFTLAPPSSSSATTIRIRVINAASAGAITRSGFDNEYGDTYATTNAKEYWFYIDWDGTRSTLTIKEIV